MKQRWMSILLDCYNFKNFWSGISWYIHFYLCLVDGGDPSGAALWAAGCEYVDIHGTLELAHLHENKWTWEKGRHHYGICYICTQNPAVSLHDRNKVLLTAVFQRYTKRSVEGQRRSNHFQSLSFLLDLGHQENVWEEERHHLQLHRTMWAGTEKKVKQKNSDWVER